MRRALLTSIVCAVAACWVVIGGTLSAADSESIDSLRKEKLKIAQEWWDVLTTRKQIGAAKDGLDGWYNAAKAVRTAELEAASDKPTRIRALTSYRDRMQKLDEMAMQQSRAGTIDFNQLQELRIAFVDAKIDLKREEEGAYSGAHIYPAK